MKKFFLLVACMIWCITITHAWWSGISSNIETKVPDYVGQLAGTYLHDINHWKNWVLESEKNKSEYLVIPSNWIVIPIIRTDTNVTSYEQIDVNSYLQKWALLLPKTYLLPYNKSGNNTIVGHSSYFKKDSGIYKTHFQYIIWLEIWTEIWIYKNENWDWKRYKFITTDSYETYPKDVSVLRAKNNKELTLITCTPIGWITWRWIVKAKFVPEVIDEFKLENETKILWDIIIQMINDTQNIMEKKKKILQFVSAIHAIEKKYSIDMKMQRQLRYLKYKLWVEISL